MTPSDLAAIEARLNAPYDATYPAVLSEAERRHDVGLLLAEVRRLTECLVKANATFEQTERDLYLQIDALESERDDWKRLACERADAHTQGYPISDYEIAKLNQRFLDEYEGRNKALRERNDLLRELGRLPSKLPPK